MFTETHYQPILIRNRRNGEAKGLLILDKRSSNGSGLFNASMLAEKLFGAPVSFEAISEAEWETHFSFDLPAYEITAKTERTGTSARALNSMHEHKDSNTTTVRELSEPERSNPCLRVVHGTATSRYLGGGDKDDSSG